MNDITWHTKEDDDFEQLIKDNPNRQAVYQTDITYRVGTLSSHNSYGDGLMHDVGEKLIKFAFLD